ncbi:MAG: hypothetical protein K2Y27_13080 [Xanthobacteraceae bacterium]|nr:hypothetical protein [Xanthobacteraceae bacterium]
MTQIPSKATLTDRLARLLGTILVFILVGPPIGGLVAVFVWLFFDLAMNKGVDGSLSEYLAAALLLVGLSYFPGFVPAAFAGFVVGITHAFLGRIPWVAAILAAVSAGFAYGLLFSRTAPGNELVMVPVGIIAILVPVVVCTAIVRSMEQRWWRRTDSSIGSA